MYATDVPTKANVQTRKQAPRRPQPTGIRADIHAQANPTKLMAIDKRLNPSDKGGITRSATASRDDALKRISLVAGATDVRMFDTVVSKYP